MALDGQKLDLLVYAGPGNLERPDNAVLLNATNLVFFEPDPERRGALSTRFKAQPNVEIRSEALSDREGYSRLGQYNDPNMNSLCAPTDLLHFIPGLRHIGYTDVKLLDASEYFSSNINKKDANGLVLDVNGEELAILKKLSEASLLGLFSEIHVYTGVSPLFDGAGGRADVMDLLRRHNFNIKAEVGQGGFLACVRARRDGPLRPGDAQRPKAEAQTVAPDPAKRTGPQAGSLRNELEAARKQIDALTRDNKSKDAEIQAQNRRASTAKGMITKLKKQEEAAREIAIERDRLKARLAEVRAAAAEADEARAVLSAQLDSVRAELAGARKQIEEGEALRQTLKNDLEQTQAMYEAAQSEAEAKAREMSEHAKKLDVLKAERDESSRLAQELEARNSRFDGEFVRAEAQLDLIKELLFHDQPE